MKELQVTVVGSGLMGNGIAQVFAAAGHSVRITSRNQARLQTVPDRIAASLLQQGADAERVLSKIQLISTVAEAVEDADIVFENVSEQLELKREIFAKIAASAPEYTILATDTSVIPITDIGEQLPPDARRRLLGTHWWNPPAVIPLVEVTSTAFTSSDVFERTFSILEGVGKKPVRVLKDVPGFIGSRLQFSLWREAIEMVEAGICDAETIDIVVKNSFGMKLAVLGPMENVDLVGLELTRDVHRNLFPYLSKSDKPSPLLDKLIEQGKLGMASGEGLRKWTEKEAQDVRTRLAQLLIQRK